MSENKCQGCPNYKKNEYTGWMQCYGNKCETEIRADERRKVLHEQRALDVNSQISAERLRADERENVLNEAILAIAEMLYITELNERHIVYNKALREARYRLELMKGEQA